MAFPVILVDSATGSDTSTSGAGPATAVTGSTASTNAGGTVVTVDALTDLSGIATDGSAALYLNDTTAGHRRWSKIVGTAGSGGATPTITVNEAYTGNLAALSWAVGGKRASVAGATSLLLLSNNSAAGDAMPGWAMQMASAHAESTSGTIDLRRSGDTTSGPITVRGIAGAATLPKITSTGGGNTFVNRGDYQILQNFEITSGANPTASAVVMTGNIAVKIVGVKLSRTSSNVFTTGINLANQASFSTLVRDCEIAFCTTGINGGGGAYALLNNYLHNCTGAGISETADDLSIVIRGNIIEGCGTEGISITNWGNGARGVLIDQNTIDASTNNGIKITAAPNAGMFTITNNILSNNGAYGLNFSSASATDAALAAAALLVVGNNTYNNTTNAYHSNTGGYTNSNCPWASGDGGFNPSYTNAGGGDFSVTNASIKAQGYPLGGTLKVGSTSATNSYPTPGAAQPNPSSGGGTSGSQAAIFGA